MFSPALCACIRGGAGQVQIHKMNEAGKDSFVCTPALPTTRVGSGLLFSAAPVKLLNRLPSFELSNASPGVFPTRCF